MYYTEFVIIHNVTVQKDKKPTTRSLMGRSLCASTEAELTESVVHKLSLDLALSMYCWPQIEKALKYLDHFTVQPYACDAGQCKL